MQMRSLQERVLDATTAEQLYNLEICYFKLHVLNKNKLI